MLYNFLLIFPKGFKGVLTTYQILFSLYFSHRVFWGRISGIYKDILKVIEEHSQDHTRRFLKITQDIFKNWRCPRGSVRVYLALELS
jgi:hypothetical protein